MRFASTTVTGTAGLHASRAAIATAGHNIANANTEGFTRQRVEQESYAPAATPGQKPIIGQGPLISNVNRINDQYLDKQVRVAHRDFSGFEDREMSLKQLEDVFNEMNGDGLNRLVSRFFNDFRKLSNDPSNTAVRQAVRESAKALVNDFHRLRNQVDDVRKHIDSRMEGYVSELNSLTKSLAELNVKIKMNQISGASPNDLLDQRDQVLKKIYSFMEVNMFRDESGSYNVDIVNVGPMVSSSNFEKFSVARTPADDQGKPENAFDLKSSASANGVITHAVRGGRIGGLLEVRDKTLSTVLARLDEMAYSITDAVNQVHQQGYSADGRTKVDFFKPLDTIQGAAQKLDLSDDVMSSLHAIATAAVPDAPGDNRIAAAIGRIQHDRIMGDGHSTFDDWYNSIIADVGVASARNAENLSQQKGILNQLTKMREQVSGVSIDEETTKLLQFQHAFDASAKVIQVADEMLKTVLDLKR